MASKIEGLTIEIGGDTSKLSQALKEPNRNIKDLNNKLRSIDTALKFDPKNTELLAQKQELLGDAVAENEEKLKLLKTAQEQFKNSGKNLNSNEYIELEKQISLTEGKLKSLKKQQDSVNQSVSKINQAGEKVKAVGDKVQEAGSKMKGVSAGAAAVEAASIAAFSEIDKGMDTVAKGTGATGQQLVQLQQIFKNVYGSMPTDVESASAAVADLNTRFGFVGNQLQTASQDFIKFAEVNNTDVSSSIALVSRAMGDAGIESSKYKEVLDALTAASQNSGITVDKLAENLTKYGAPMRALGYDTKESIAIFSSWEKAGVNTEIAFSGMKKAISNYTASGKDAKVEFANLIKGIQDGSISGKQAMEVFGQKAGPDLVDAIKNGRFSFEEMMRVVEGSGGQLSKTYDATLDPIDKAKEATNNLKLAGSDLGNSLLTTLAPVIETVAEKTKEFTTWFNSLSPEIKSAISVIGTIIAVLSPVLIIVGKLISIVGTAISFISKLAPLFSFLASPIGVVVAAIAAVIAILVLLYNKCEWFRNIVNGIVQGVVDFVKGAIDGIVVFFTQTIPQIIENIINWFKELPTNLVNIITTGFNNFVNAIKSAIGLISSVIKKVFNTVVNGVINLPSNLIKIGKNIIKGFVNGIKNTISLVKNVGTTIFDTVKNFFKDPLKTLLNVGGNLITGLWNGISDKVGWITSKIKGFGETVLGSIKDFFGIHSPSRVMKDQVGKNIALGVIKGVDGQKKNAKKSAKKLGSLYVSAGKKKVTEMKKANKMTEADEVSFWKKIASKCKKGTSAYKTAMSNMKKAQTKLNKDISKIDKNYKTDVKKVKDDLIKDVKDLTKVYDEAVESRQKEIVGSMDLLEKFKPEKSFSKQQLTRNLQSQVDALRDWDNTLDSLKKKKGMTSSLMEELQGMDVSQLNYLKEIQSMSDSEFKKYVDLYNQKNKIATERAVTENEGLKKSTEKEIQNLMTEANKQLKALDTQYKNDLKKLGVSQKVNASYVGKNVVSGIWKGIDDNSTWLNGKITGFSKDITKKLKKVFKIKSPSRVMSDEIGKYISAGIGEGIIGNEKLALNPLNKLQNKMTNTFDPNLSAEVNKSLETSNQFYFEIPITATLDGKPIYKDVINRITRERNMKLVFKGG